MRLKLRFAAPVVLACSIVTAAWAVPAGGNREPATSPQPITYTGPSSQSRAKLIAGIQAGLEQQRQDQETWNAAVAANEAEAARQAAQQRQERQESSGTVGAAASAPTPEAAGDGSDAEAAVRKYFGDMFASAWGVSECESGHDPSSVSRGGGNWGLFQINTVHAKEFEAVTGKPFYNGSLDAFANAQYARHLYNESGGWGPWACRWAA